MWRMQEDLGLILTQIQDDILWENSHLPSFRQKT